MGLTEHTGYPDQDGKPSAVGRAPCPLQRHLDAIGLPWRATYAELVARFGVTVDSAKGSRVIRVASTRPFMRGMLHPLQVRAVDGCEPGAPVGPFETLVSFGLGAAVNFRQAILLLQPVLGDGVAEDLRVHAWRFGHDSVTLHIGDDAGADPRMRAACRLTLVIAGRRPSALGNRVGRLGFIPILQFDEGLQQTTIYRPSLKHLRDYRRKPSSQDAGLYRWVGWSADRSTLIVFNNDLFMIPVGDIVRLEVTRIVPARGGGGSMLDLVCRAARPGANERWIEIATGPHADALTDVATRIADALDKPLVLRPYEYDA